MRWGMGVWSVVVLSLLAPGCGGRETVPRADPDARLLIIGVDGAEWDEMLPLMAAGELPNFTALARDGYAAHLTTFAPALSPRRSTASWVFWPRTRPPVRGSRSPPTCAGLAPCGTFWGRRKWMWGSWAGG